MVRRACTIVENNSGKKGHLKELKENLRTYSYPEKIVKIRIQKELKIRQTELCLPKTIKKQKKFNFHKCF